MLFFIRPEHKTAKWNEFSVQLVIWFDCLLSREKPGIFGCSMV